MAYENGNPIGYVWYSIDIVLENPFKLARTQIYIHQIVVDESFRSQSVGNALLNKVEEVGRRHGIRLLVF